jgi:hypothetical protein
MTAATVCKRNITTVAVVGCLALVAVVTLGLWSRFSPRASAGGGSTSVGGTSVQYVSASPDGGISLVIWSDLTGRAGQQAHSDLFDSHTTGFFSAADGRRVEWGWRDPKEKGGAFQINGTAYDLAHGTLFLVSTTGGQVRVTQLDADLSRVKPDEQGLEAFAENQPQVAQFIAEASGRK